MPTTSGGPTGPRTRVQVEARGFGWRHAGRKKPAIQDISFTLQPGEKVLLLGPSGSGKSTLMAGLAGVLGDAEDGEYSGELLINGQPAQAARGLSGLVLQDPDSQVISSRVGDDIAFGCENLGIPREEIWRRVLWAKELVGLTEDVDHPTAALSGGQKQRLALAGVLAMGAGLILLDEPTANIDPEGVLDVRAAVLRAAEETGATLVIVEHHVEIWQDHVDRVIVLGGDHSAGSGVIADGPLDEVLNRYGDELAAQGVWIPGIALDIDATWASRANPATASAPALMHTHDLAVGWSEKPIHTGISVDLSATATVLTGPNGTGKSTAALTLAGLLPPVAGSIDASPIASGDKPEPIRWKSKALITRIGTVFQDPEHQFVARSVEEELLTGPRLVGMDPDVAQARCAELLERLKLTAVAKANPFTLSGGQKRRLSVATVLSTKPELLVLDEPTFGQDRTTFTELIALLREMSESGVGVLAITHDPLVVEYLGARHLHMLPGEPGVEVVR